MEKNKNLLFVLGGVLLLYVFSGLFGGRGGGGGRGGDPTDDKKSDDPIIPGSSSSETLNTTAALIRRKIYPYGTGFGYGFLGDSDEAGVLAILNALSVADTRNLVLVYARLYGSLSDDLLAAEGANYWKNGLKNYGSIF